MPTISTKHTKRRSPTKLLRLPIETHRALKWVAAQRQTTMTACLAKLVERAHAREFQKVERRVLKRNGQSSNQPTAQVA